MNFVELFDQLSKIITAFSKKQKIIVFGSFFAIVSFLVFISLYRPAGVQNDFVPIFDKINPKDSSIILEQLETDGIKYKLADNNLILVSKNDVYKVRIKVAAAGISQKSGTGFELFDKSSFGATAFEQKIKYLRAIEGEIERSISSLIPIKSAKVHIAIAKDTLFVSQKQSSTASVILTISPFNKLKTRQIMGIQNLVSSAVFNLSPEDVKIVDQTGTPLGGDSLGFESDTIKAQISYKKRFEQRLEEKIVNIISPFAGGREKIVAKVNIDFDFSKKSEKSEYFDPNSVTRSEQTLEEKKEGTSKQQVGGVPGAVSNIGPVQGLDGDKSSNKYEKNTNTINYEISTKVTNIQSEFAHLQRVTAAVIIDGKYKDIEGKIKYVPLSQKQIEQISNLTKQSIGYNQKRGDSISVTNLQFQKETTTLSSTALALLEAKSLIAPLAPALKLLFVFILLLVLYKKIIVPFSKKMLEDMQDTEADEIANFLQDNKDPTKEEDILEDYKRRKAEIEKQLGLHEAKGDGDIKYDVILDKLVKYIEDHPQDTASLLETLLEKEDQELVGF